MQGNMDWEDARLVHAIGAAGTLTGAAKRLGINHSTAFRRLAQIEARLGVRLFDRGRDGYAATPAGDAVIAAAGQFDSAMIEVERRLAGQDLRPSGLVRLTSTDTLIQMITPSLAAFRRAHPEITLELIATNNRLALERREADVAIRPSAEAPDMLVGRRLSVIAFTSYAARDLLTPEFSPLLHEHDWVMMDDSLIHLPWMKGLLAAVPAERRVYRANSLSALLAAARAGMGLAVLPCYLADGMSDLCRLHDPVPGWQTNLWLLTHPDLRRTARVRAFLDFMAVELGRKRILLEGQAGAPCTAPLLSPPV